MNEIVTADLSKFGYRELAMASELLKAYSDNGCDFLGNGITINFNNNSGYVFLSDDDLNIAILENDKLVQFFSCMQCGFEGTQEEAKFNKKDFVKYNGYCSKKCENDNK